MAEEATRTVDETEAPDPKAELDTSEGWCCDGRTYKEHAHADGKCCQPKGTQLEELPEDAQKKARERQQQEGAS
jgi:hypothetical protein